VAEAKLLAILATRAVLAVHESIVSFFIPP
jgi:hypothetical protein